MTGDLTVEFLINGFLHGNEVALITNFPSFLAPPGWTFGDGTGGSESHVVVADRDACVTTCLNNYPAANGATVNFNSQTSCFCETGQTGTSGSTNYINKYIR